MSFAALCWLFFLTNFDERRYWVLVISCLFCHSFRMYPSSPSLALNFLFPALLTVLIVSSVENMPGLTSHNSLTLVLTTLLRFIPQREGIWLP